MLDLPVVVFLVERYIGSSKHYCDMTIYILMIIIVRNQVLTRVQEQYAPLPGYIIYSS